MIHYENTCVVCTERFYHKDKNEILCQKHWKINDLYTKLDENKGDL